MQDYPKKPMRLITFEAGGGVDMVARLIADGISGPLGQPVTVENHPGVRAVELVVKAPPDGYTLLFFGPSFWTAPLLKKVPYDPVTDFSPITMAINQPNILVVHPSVKANSVKELIDLARARPGELKYASGVTGSSSQLAGALFSYMAGVDVVGVPYMNTARLGVGDLIAGKVQFMIFSAGSGISHVKAGRLRALAVTSTKPSALFPELPSVAETLPGYESIHVQSVYAPAKTPVAVISRLNQEIVGFLDTAEAKKRLFNAGIEAIGSTPEELAAKVKSEMAMGKLINEVGTKID